MRGQALEQKNLSGGFFIARFCLLLCFIDALRHGVQVGQDEFGGDHFNITHRIDAAHGVDHVAVFEAPHYMNDRVDLSNIGEELVAEALALAGAGDKAGDVDKLDGGGNDDISLCDFLKNVGPFIGHNHDADVGFDGAKRVVCSFGLARASEGVEESGLADVGQTDDASFEHKDGNTAAGVGA